MNDIFLAYGVRGIAGKTLTEALVKKIGWAFGEWLKKVSGKPEPTVVLTRDVRISSDAFYAAAYSGLAAAGAEVIPAGIATTPMCLFAINHHHADGGIAITASHNPPEWNGIKFYREDSMPIGLENGLDDVRALSQKAPKIPDRTVSAEIPVLEEYEAFLARSFKERLERKARPVKIVVDNGNGAAARIFERAVAHFPWLEAEKLFWDEDGAFPGRGPNPLLQGALEPLQKQVRETDADFGVAFDADGDRVFFTDERGEIVLPDWILGWLCDEYLAAAPSEKIILPIGSPRIAEDAVRQHGGEPIFSKVGFVTMRKDMRTANAIFGGERSGHYYFRDFFFGDSGIWAFLTVFALWLEKKKPFSEIIRPYRKYVTTGEINIRVKDRAAALGALKTRYAKTAKATSELDGFFADMGEWWLLARPSNTEPLIRIVVESADAAITARARQEVLGLLQ